MFCDNILWDYIVVPNVYTHTPTHTHMNEPFLLKRKFLQFPTKSPTIQDAFWPISWKPNGLQHTESVGSYLPTHTYTHTLSFLLQAALIMQVLSLTDDQIQLLPPEQRASILKLKEQIAMSSTR